MAGRPFPTSPHYEQSLLGLHRLHELAAAGQNDSPEADAVRDSLDVPWMLLSETEKKRITGLSEDLYSLSEPRVEPLPSSPQVQRRLNEAEEACQAGEWDRALEVLRRWHRHVDPALLSYIRGKIWLAADDYRTATPFLRHAAEFDPSESKYVETYLMALEKSDAVAAASRAEEILQKDSDHPPGVIGRAAEILFIHSRSMEAASTQDLARRLIPILERTLDRAEKEQSPSTTTSLRASINELLGLCNDTLGENKTALSYFDTALALQPNDDTALVMRGILRYLGDQANVEDFKVAIRRDSRTFWPYYFLAHHELVSNEFKECLGLCDTALKYEVPDEIRGDLYEWSAIARFELGSPAERVRTLFEEALRFAPDSDRIRANLQAFDRIGLEKGSRSHSWQKPREAVVRESGRSSLLSLAM